MPDLYDGKVYGFVTSSTRKFAFAHVSGIAEYNGIETQQTLATASDPLSATLALVDTNRRDKKTILMTSIDKVSHRATVEIIEAENDKAVGYEAESYGTNIRLSLMAERISDALNRAYKDGKLDTAEVNGLAALTQTVRAALKDRAFENKEAEAIISLADRVSPDALPPAIAPPIKTPRDSLRHEKPVFKHG